MSFQNLAGASKRFVDLFGIDLSTQVEPAEWRAAVVAFQKRHLIAHRMGVVDQNYVDKTGDSLAVVGRKIIVDADEVKRLLGTLNTLAARTAERLQESKGHS